MLNLNDGRAPNEATLRVKQLEAVSFCSSDLGWVNISYRETKFQNSICLNSEAFAPITDQACWDSPELRFSISLWYQVAERLGVSLGQLVVAWSIRNATSQCVILSANTVDHMVTLLNSLQVRVLVLKESWKLWCRTNFSSYRSWPTPSWTTLTRCCPTSPAGPRWCPHFNRDGRPQEECRPSKTAFSKSYLNLSWCFICELLHNWTPATFKLFIFCIKSLLIIVCVWMFYGINIYRILWKHKK